MSNNIDSNHIISLYIEGQLTDLRDDFTIRMNDTVWVPEQLKTTRASYSFSFELPSTPTNDKIFDYANAVGKEDKFRSRYDTELYSDEVLIFKGSLIVEGYNHDNMTYSCNLVEIRTYSLAEIFEEDMLTDCKWYVPFSGASTINSVNADLTTKYFFPLVSYGVFIKEPYHSDDVANDYTSKFVFDEWNKWYYSTFQPSLNAMEMVKRLLKWKGYEVNGTAFNDPIISNIYLSESIAKEQVPLWNYGLPIMGRAEIAVNWNNMNDVPYVTQDLSFPYRRISPSNDPTEGEYNFSAINVWNIWDTKNNPNGVAYSYVSDNYLYDEGDSVLVIPADGFYQIDLVGGFELQDYGGTFTADQMELRYSDADGYDYDWVQMTITKDFNGETPFELQLIRNYDDNIELIKGRNNVRYLDGNPNNEIATNIRGGAQVQNKITWQTDFPHQDLMKSVSPTLTAPIMSNAVALNSTDIRTINGRVVDNTDTAGSADSGGRSGGRIEGNPSTSTTQNQSSTRRRISRQRDLGYMHNGSVAGGTMPFDQAVTESFICGASTMDSGSTVSVMKNGRSWSKLNATSNEVFTNMNGMEFVTVDSGTTSMTQTTLNENSYNGSANNSAPNSDMGWYLGCNIHMLVKLNRNDRLELCAVQRDFDGQQYAVSGSCNFKIMAVSPRTYNQLKGDNKAYTPFNGDSEFDTELNLFNFTNKSTKCSDFINNIITAFNLDVKQDGNSFTFDVNKGIRKNLTNYIDLDNRVSDYEYEEEKIDYPRTMAVKYKIDTDEWGFERTVPQSHINADDWKKWGDSGFTVIQLDDDAYNTTNRNVSTNFSYTWYDTFSMGGAPIKIPTISKSEYMVDGYGYDEAMKVDGYSMNQRMWFRQPRSEYSVRLASHMVESVYFSLPINAKDGVNLSYKDSEISLLTEYFNTHPLLSSHYTEVEAYISPIEYQLLRDGAMCKVGDDLHYISTISGFDATGKNPSTLRMVKKTK